MKDVTFSQAFTYPFNRAKGLLNGFWLLLPVLGWLALFGYTIRIHQGFIKGKFKETPKMKFWDDFKFGIAMFFKIIPLLIFIGALSILGEMNDILYVIFLLFVLLMVPILGMNFIRKETVASSFEFRKTEGVFTNFFEYLVAWVQSLVLGIIFLVFSIVLVGIPAGMYTKNIFFANFYRKFCL